MPQTPHLKLPYIMASQAQKHITHNQAIQILDSLIQLSVIDRQQTLPPQAPNNGERYLVAENSVSDWLGQDNKITIWNDNNWIFLEPQKGWQTWVENENRMLIWTGTSWDDMPVSQSQINNLELLGINTTADTTNKLSVTSSAILFNNESGNIRTILNKNTASDVASIIFQTNFTGHTEIGLNENNQFKIKTSSDGITWLDAIQINSSSGETEFQQPISLNSNSKSNLPNATPAGRLIYINDASGGATIAFSDGTNWKRISDNTIIN